MEELVVVSRCFFGIDQPSLGLVVFVVGFFSGI